MIGVYLLLDYYVLYLKLSVYGILGQWLLNFIEFYDSIKCFTMKITGHGIFSLSGHDVYLGKPCSVKFRNKCY